MVQIEEHIEQMRQTKIEMTKCGAKRKRELQKHYNRLWKQLQEAKMYMNRGEQVRCRKD